MRKTYFFIIGLGFLLIGCAGAQSVDEKLLITPKKFTKNGLGELTFGTPVTKLANVFGCHLETNDTVVACRRTFEKYPSLEVKNFIEFTATADKSGNLSTIRLTFPISLEALTDSTFDIKYIAKESLLNAFYFFRNLQIKQPSASMPFIGLGTICRRNYMGDISPCATTNTDNVNVDDIHAQLKYADPNEVFLVMLSSAPGWHMEIKQKALSLIFQK